MAKYNKNFNYAKNKKETDKKIKTIQESLEKKLTTLGETLDSKYSQDLIKKSLKNASKFKSYSFYNELLLTFQAKSKNIELEQVAAIGTWKSINKNITPKKGESALYIYKGMQIPLYKKDENGHFILDDENKKIPLLDEQDNPKYFMRYSLTPVFDVNQTNAKEIGAYISEIKNKNIVDVPISYINIILNEIKKKYGFEINIDLNEDNFNSEKLTNIFLELGRKTDKLNNIGEVESFAYSLSNMFGIETDLNLKIEFWPHELKELTEKIKNISSAISSTINTLNLNEHVLDFQKLNNLDVVEILEAKITKKEISQPEISDFDLI